MFIGRHFDKESFEKRLEKALVTGPELLGCLREGFVIRVDFFSKLVGFLVNLSRGVDRVLWGCSTVYLVLLCFMGVLYGFQTGCRARFVGVWTCGLVSCPFSYPPRSQF